MPVLNMLNLAKMARPASARSGVFGALQNFSDDGMRGAQIGGALGAAPTAYEEATDGEPGADLDRVVANGLGGAMLGVAGGTGVGTAARGVAAAGRGAADLLFALKRAGLSKPEQVAAYFQRLGRAPTETDFLDAQSIVGRLNPDEVKALVALLRGGGA